MIAVTKVRDLNLPAGAGAGRPAHLSAASGLVWLGSLIYVVADDELHLGIFDPAGAAPGRLMRLFEGALPASKGRRKTQKPDLEALTRLPPFGRYPDGALLALGSGSTPNRRRGALLGLDGKGAISGAPRILDLSDFFAVLDTEFDAPNIEGALVSADELRLLQRGNRRNKLNAIVRFPLSGLLDALEEGPRIGPIAPSAVDRFDLGRIGGIPLCFTDAAALPDGGMMFTAVAEDTDDAYNDGPCMGAAIGLIGEDGNLRWLRELDQPHKIEGVDARMEGDRIGLLLVTDADDADIPASLFSATITKTAD